MVERQPRLARFVFGNNFRQLRKETILVVNNTGLIDASGEAGGTASSPSGADGGGSGGSILIQVSGSWNVGTNLVKAGGGAAGLSPGFHGPSTTSQHLRSGGYGGSGRIHFSPSSGTGTNMPAAQ